MELGRTFVIANAFPLIKELSGALLRPSRILSWVPNPWLISLMSRPAVNAEEHALELSYMGDHRVGGLPPSSHLVDFHERINNQHQASDHGSWPRDTSEVASFDRVPQAYTDTFVPVRLNLLTMVSRLLRSRPMPKSTRRSGPRGNTRVTTDAVPLRYRVRG